MSEVASSRSRIDTDTFDADALEAWLARNIEGFEGPLSIEAFAGGRSNPTFKLTTPKRTFVARTKPDRAEKLLPSAHAIEREFEVMRSLRGTDVPVAQVFCLCKDEDVIGSAFYVMEFVDGRVLWDPALPGMSREQRRAVYVEMNRVIAALHTVNVADVGLAQFGRSGDYFGRQIARWAKQYAASVTEPIPEMESLMEWLPRNIPAAHGSESTVSLVHGDFRLDNLIFHPTEARVLAVLDWELSTLGHPLADLSYQCLAWHVPPGTLRGVDGLDLASLGIPSEAEYLSLYCDRTRLATPAMLTPNWNFYLAYNMFRLAAILQGVAKRTSQDVGLTLHTNTQAGGSPASDAKLLARAAWELARKS